MKVCIVSFNTIKIIDVFLKLQVNIIILLYVYLPPSELYYLLNVHYNLSNKIITFLLVNTHSSRLKIQFTCTVNGDDGLIQLCIHSSPFPKRHAETTAMFR